MQSSDFQFSNPVLINLDFEIKKDFNSLIDRSIDIQLAFDVEINKVADKNEAVVELTVVVGTKDNSNPFYIKATEGAKFRWDEKAISNKNRLLEQNAPALLLGYLRPIISAITVASPFNAYHVPFIDFTKE